MEDLLPLAVHLRTERRAWWRSTLVTAATFDVPLVVLILAASAYVGRDGRVLLLGLLGGLVVSILWMVRTGWSARKRIRRIHRGDPAIVPAPPEGAHEYRLACRCVSPMLGLEGYLYAAPDALTFVPHRDHPGPEVPLVVPAGPALAFETFDTSLRGAARMLKRSVHYMRVRNGEASALFEVLDPDVVAGRLRRYYPSAAACPSAPGA